MKMLGLLNHQSLLQYVDNFRIEIFRLNADRERDRKRLGQFFTPIEVAQQMTRLLDTFPPKLRVVDPGAGAGMLSAALIAHLLSKENLVTSEIEIVAYELDRNAATYLAKTFAMCRELCRQRGIKLHYVIYNKDFIDAAISQLQGNSRYDIAILNPPYRKIRSGSKEWKKLRKNNLPHSNLYAAFVTLAAILLKRRGKLLSITPRSFCNGPYFLPFRKALLSQVSIGRVHIYNSRIKAFSTDDVLQENVILCAEKSCNHAEVRITSCDGPLDRDISVQRVRSEELVDLRDRNLFIYLARNRYERRIYESMRKFKYNIHDLDINVSTGRVVDFRARDLLRMPNDPGSVPLILPAHLLDGFVKWPIHRSRKPSAIHKNSNEKKLLLPNDCYVLVKRFTAKEQKRRLTAAVLDPGRINFNHVGIENHLNYFHQNGSGLPMDLAKGLAAYLNSTMVDQFFRLFSGHTQVNATDLRNLKYPDSRALTAIGKRIGDAFPIQETLDHIIREELHMPEDFTSSQMKARVDDALEILRGVNVPKAQQNIRSALTLLSLVGIKPSNEWSEASAPLLRIKDMMDFFSAHYDTEYAPNTRETVRRYTIHQFWQMGIVVHNPDEPNRPINSPNYCYQIADSFLELVRSFGSPMWDDKLTFFKIVAGEKLNSLHSPKRTMQTIPVTLPDGSFVNLTAGGQNALIKSVIEQFCPRFASGGEVLYLGDAGDKLNDSQIRRFRDLGIELDRHGKSPDVILYLKRENWLILIEAVTSHGPIDQKRHNELRDLFSKGSAELVFVTAFPSRRAMTKFLNDISWETEVWIADAPDHLIHFDGERFLGPY